MLSIPRTVPAKISVGKCTPKYTLDIPTRTAHMYAEGASAGIIRLINVAKTKAAEVCPDGKLNLSGGLTWRTMCLWKSKGLFLFVLFLTIRYNGSSMAYASKPTLRKTIPKLKLIRISIAAING